MHWCCTEGPEAYVGDRAVVDSLADELIAVVGDEVYVELRRRLSLTSDFPIRNYNRSHRPLEGE